MKDFFDKIEENAGLNIEYDRAFVKFIKKNRNQK